jgi:hypothetical protein
MAFGQKVAHGYLLRLGAGLTSNLIKRIMLERTVRYRRTNIQIASRTFQFLLASPPQDRLQTESLVGQSPTSSLVDVIDSDPANSPTPTLRDTSLPAQPTLSLPMLCCHAIEALGGKATLGQIRRWLTAEYEWYRLNDGWQVTTDKPYVTVTVLTRVHRPPFAAYCLPTPYSTKYDEKKVTRAKTPFTRSGLEQLEKKGSSLVKLGAVTATQRPLSTWKET